MKAQLVREHLMTLYDGWVDGDTSVGTFKCGGLEGNPG